MGRRLCIFHWFLGDIDAAGSGTTFVYSVFRD